MTVSVNWQELRVLVMWAEGWERAHSLGRTVYAIARRLRDQHPENGPLTLAEEIGEIAGEYDVSVSDADLRRDIAEQTGEEVGLIEPPRTP